MTHAVHPNQIEMSIGDKIHEQSWNVAEYVINNFEKPHSMQHQLNRFVELKALLAKSMAEVVDHFQRSKDDR